MTRQRLGTSGGLQLHWLLGLARCPCLREPAGVVLKDFREKLSRGSGAGTSGAAAKVARVCNRGTIAPTSAPIIARIVALRATIGAIVGAVVGAIVSRLQTIAIFAAAPLVPAPFPQLKDNCENR